MLVNIGMKIVSYEGSKAEAKPDYKLIDRKLELFGVEGGELSSLSFFLSENGSRVIFDRVLEVDNRTWKISHNAEIFHLTLENKDFVLKGETPTTVKVDKTEFRVISVEKGKIVLDCTVEEKSAFAPYGEKKKIPLTFMKEPLKMVYLESNDILDLIINEGEYRITPLEEKESKNKAGVLFMTSEVNKITVRGIAKEYCTGITMIVWSK